LYVVENYKNRKPPWNNYDWDKDFAVLVFQKAISLSSFLTQSIFDKATFNTITSRNFEHSTKQQLDNNKLDAMRLIMLSWCIVYITDITYSLNETVSYSPNQFILFLNLVLNSILVNYEHGKTSKKAMDSSFKDMIFLETIQRFNNHDKTDTNTIYDGIVEEISAIINVNPSQIKQCINEQFKNEIINKLDLPNIVVFPDPTVNIVRKYINKTLFFLGWHLAPLFRKDDKNVQ